MDNKIKLNAEKRVEPRLTIPYKGQNIIVNEPSDTVRGEMIETLVRLITENKDFDEKEMLNKLINYCTNVEFDKDVFEVVELSHEAKMITNEVLMIFQEIIGESYQVINLMLQQIKNEELQNKLLNGKKMLENLIQYKYSLVNEQQIVERFAQFVENKNV